MIVPRFIADTRELGEQLPALIEQNILTPLERYVPVGVIREELRDGIELPRSRVFAYMRNAAAAIASVFAVLFMVAYMLIDAERLRNLFLLVYPPEVRGRRQTHAACGSAKRMSAWLSGAAAALRDHRRRDVRRTHRCCASRTRCRWRSSPRSAS